MTWRSRCTATSCPPSCWCKCSSTTAGGSASPPCAGQPPQVTTTWPRTDSLKCSDCPIIACHVAPWNIQAITHIKFLLACVTWGAHGSLMNMLTDKAAAKHQSSDQCVRYSSLQWWLICLVMACRILCGVRGLPAGRRATLEGI